MKFYKVNEDLIVNISEIRALQRYEYNTDYSYQILINSGVIPITKDEFLNIQKKMLDN